MRIALLALTLLLTVDPPAQAENKPKMLVRAFGAVGMWSPGCNNNKPSNFTITIQDKNEEMGDPEGKDYSNDPAKMDVMAEGDRMFVLTEVVKAEVTGDTLTMYFSEERFAAGHGWETQPATTAVFQKKGRQMLVSGGAFMKFVTRPTLVNLCRR